MTTEKTSEKKPSFVYVTYIATSAEKLFAALTDGKFTQEYWAGEIVASDWKKGSPVRYHRRNAPATTSVQGEILEIDPPSLLSMTWRHASPGMPTAATKVTFALKQVSPGNVRLQVTHEEHEPGSVVHERVREGWPAILSSLKTYLETGEALEVTKRWEAGVPQSG